MILHASSTDIQPTGWWGFHDCFEPLQKDLEQLVVASKNVLLDKTATSVLQELHDTGLDELANHLVDFPFHFSRRGSDFDLNKLKSLILKILQNQKDLRAQARFCLQFTTTLRLKRCAKIAAKAFASLLENWFSLELRCLKASASHEQVQRWETLLTLLSEFRIRLNRAADNNTWEQLYDRTVSYLFEAASQVKRNFRRHILNSVYLPLLI